MSVRVCASECLRDCVCNVHFYIVLHRPKHVLSAHRFRQFLNPVRVVRLAGHEERPLSHAHVSRPSPGPRNTPFYNAPDIFAIEQVICAPPSALLHYEALLRRLALRRLALPGGLGGGLDSRIGDVGPYQSG